MAAAIVYMISSRSYPRRTSVTRVVEPYGTKPRKIPGQCPEKVSDFHCSEEADARKMKNMKNMRSMKR